MNILIVDDETDSLEEIEICVKEYGRSDFCVLCSNALEALLQAKNVSFDVALLDIEMPVMNGLELAEILQTSYPNIRIIFLTAYNNYAAEAFEVNAIDYILKPVRHERVFAALNKFTSKNFISVGDAVIRSNLSIYMFGKFTVRVGEKLIKWNRQKSLEIFAYLVENKDYPVRKEVLCELFWYDLIPQKALVNLQTAMYSLRNTLRQIDNSKISIEYSLNNYTIHIKDVFIDVEQFERLFQKASDFNNIDYLKQAVILYKDGYLEEEGWLWAEPKKSTLRKKYLSALQSVKRNSSKIQNTEK